MRITDINPLQQIRMAEIEQASLKSEQLSDKSSSPALPDDLSLDEHTAYQLLVRDSKVGLSKVWWEREVWKMLNLMFCSATMNDIVWWYIFLGTLFVICHFFQQYQGFSWQHTSSDFMSWSCLNTSHFIAISFIYFSSLHNVLCQTSSYFWV